MLDPVQPLEYETGLLIQRNRHGMVTKHFTNRKVLCWSGVLAAVVDQENVRFISFFALKSAIV